MVSKYILAISPFHPMPPFIEPFYRLAEECNIPVIFHTGDTESSNSKLKCAHPSGIDEIAIEYPQVKFLIAHLGNPFLMDAAEVIAKNKNVYADLSGFVAGADDFDYSTRYQLPRLKEAVERIGDTSRLLYGSDWPLTPMKEYINFIRTLFPHQDDQEKVFFKNALEFFKIAEYTGHTRGIRCQTPVTGAVYPAGDGVRVRDSVHRQSHFSILARKSFTHTYRLCTRSTRNFTFSKGVFINTHPPRLKTWAGAALPSCTIALTRFSITSSGAKRQ